MSIVSIERKTEFSPCRKYRYTLWREWQVGFTCDFSQANADAQIKFGKYLMVIGLNPSTADESKDDPTIRRCIAFAKGFGFGALCMTNLFAWRDTKPANMKKAEDPSGPENNDWLLKIGQEAGMIIAAWGKNGDFRQRNIVVTNLIAGIQRPLMCLRKNSDGSPEHPLYIPADTHPIPYP